MEYYMSGKPRKNSGAGSSSEAAKAAQRQRHRTLPLVKQGDIAPDISPTLRSRAHKNPARIALAGLFHACVFVEAESRLASSCAISSIMERSLIALTRAKSLSDFASALRISRCISQDLI